MRGWLILSRLSNLPTIVTNVLAGAALAGEIASAHVPLLMLAMALLYTGGMVLNDVCDLAHDRVHRPTRPIPAGVVGRTAATVAAAAMMAGGVGLVTAGAVNGQGAVWALALAGAIALYDIRHKRNRFAPLVMGACRGLVYVTVVAALAGRVDTVVWVAAAGLTGYVAGLTLAARRLPPVRPYVGLLVAAISLVDAVVLLWLGVPGAAALAAAAVPVTLLLQRWVPGD